MCDYLFAQRGHRILSLHCMCFTRLNQNYASPVICDRCYYRRFSTISKRIWIVCSFNLGSVRKYARRGDSKSQARSYRYFRWCVNNFLKYKMFFFIIIRPSLTGGIMIQRFPSVCPRLTTWYIRGRWLLLFKVGGQRSSLYCHIVGKRCRQDTE